MAKIAQIAWLNARPDEWLQGQYLDHQDNPGFLGRIFRQDRDGNVQEGDENLAIQIYSKTPTQPGDFEKFHHFAKLCTFMEIYSYNPTDAFACVRHQRREITPHGRLHTVTHQS
ncbi:uncharacterized protein N7482_001894 [Penicillium canariense]|uniref:Uncharacterized protein n=1 Tax=Penicillium canariense TaxID=189055 RepID=A0A9W9IGI4_9EURO|nr:uncharacterized protein N7482_001894 [Penicillium canariense]KAJ5176017.1 hypothetical protein N7482_001894 [Penicillium canariense]